MDQQYLPRRKKRNLTYLLSSCRKSLEKTNVLTVLRTRSEVKARNNTHGRIPPLLQQLWLWRCETFFGVLLICAWRHAIVQYQKAFKILSQGRNISCPWTFRSRPQYARGVCNWIWRSHSENASNVFRLTCAWESWKRNNHRYFGLLLRKSHCYRDVIVFEKLRSPKMVSIHGALKRKAGVFRFLPFEECFRPVLVTDIEWTLGLIVKM